MKCSMPAAFASSTTCWITGRSTTVSISLGTALVAGRNRVPRPATGKTAFRTRFLGVVMLASLSAAFETAGPAINVAYVSVVIQNAGVRPVRLRHLCQKKGIAQMSVLVTGGAGYIGSHMALELLDAGEKVVVLDDLSTGLAWALPKGAIFVEGDV